MLGDSIGSHLFANTTTVHDFYLRVSMVAGEKMMDKDNTLIFLDVLQAYPHLLTMLKFLQEDNRFTYIASGSLLGVTLSETPSIGKNLLKLYLNVVGIMTDIPNGSNIRAILDDETESTSVPCMKAWWLRSWPLTAASCFITITAIKTRSIF